MLFYSVQELMWMVLAAVVIDWMIGDPTWRWMTHPVVWIGRLITLLEKRLYPRSVEKMERTRSRGAALAIVTIGAAYCSIWLIVWFADQAHPWLGYGVSAWLISTTIAVKGLKDAAMAVYKPLSEGNILEARKWVGYIVGRNTSQLDEPEITRATVETVAENIVDAFVSPICYALLGGAPLAMLYRASNTLDSMVGYKNEKYIHFGWASARWDDVMNWIPARLTGVLLVLVAWFSPGLRAGRATRSIMRFARLHPSPNSGIPESAVAGALGIELGGVNVYHGRLSERARMGWPLREREREDIRRTVRILYGVSYLVTGGLLCGLFWLYG
ncbi:MULTISPECIES: adenosylcobinamide-phosphate synthase CbiB [unclassified Paenibacillus]|uniref:adenosylcobinamide-phosphate synthase CbiB n=1 Tax=unclassified Paenibacillus TaxID=185978 RepID=UPI001AE3804E|nr:MULTISPECIES: adenosylcobinamide-phosphate synthase CbiB [unclassified Paenibacillus]MBP1156804.1 adenosylcobinamide-phosphate synthase [Paenibacillus sp. PvP091]MBP1172457.1 adenosylcobinamide-phosphate synthase [Paenibacillus sp. PvR098]MBP2438838.1 adenosylcobinamide-phosphate synthase [Paenibacillus sp. PvP052]